MKCAWNYVQDFCPASSTPNSIWGTGPSPLRVYSWYGRAMILRPYQLRPLQSWPTRWASQWGLQVVPPHCMMIVVSCCWTLCTWQRCGRIGCTYAVSVPASSSWHTQCTIFLAWIGRGHRRRRRAGSSGKRRPFWYHSTSAIPPSFLGGGAAPNQAASIMGLLLFFPGG